MEPTATLIIMALFTVSFVVGFIVYRQRSKVDIVTPPGSLNKESSKDPPDQPGVRIEDTASRRGGIESRDKTGRGAKLRGANIREGIEENSEMPDSQRDTPTVRARSSVSNKQANAGSNISALAGDYHVGPKRPYEYTDLRLDTALPSQAEQYRSFELAVAICQTDSPPLREDDLDQTRSGDLQVVWPDDASSIALRVHVSAPECTLSRESHAFRLSHGQDFPVFYLQLTPQQKGYVRIVVTVYQEEEWLGETRLRTLVQETSSG